MQFTFWSEKSSSSARKAAGGLASALALVSAAGPGLSATAAYTTWRSPTGGSQDSSNYTNLRQITPANVAKLRPAWTYSTGDERQWAFSPIVIGTVIYGFAHDQDLVALDATTGREIWRRAAPPGSTNMRGFNYWESKDGKDRRLLLTGGTAVFAVNADNGRPITTFGVGGRADRLEGLARDPGQIRALASKGSGRIFENLLILGSAPGESYETVPGDIQAFDVVTGKPAWIFHTIPRPGEFGYETSPPNGYRWIGAANNWGDQSLDEKNGIIFLPLGSPTYDFWGGDRPGANLYGNSIIALDARTGKRLWHFQTIHHDLWDYDLVSAPQLVTIRQNGRSVDVVAQAGKNGFLYVLNRLTGKPIWPIPEKPVPASTAPGEHASPTQPIPSRPPPFARQSFTEKDLDDLILTGPEREEFRTMLRGARNEGIYTPPAFQQYSVMMPGHSGGSALGGTSADPMKGMVYIVSFDGPAFIRLEESQAEASKNTILGPRVPGLGCDTICRDEAPARGAPAAPPARPADPQQVAAGKSLFDQHCQVCHGANAQGGVGPSLIGAVGRLGAATVRTDIKNGGGQMPAFPSLSDADVGYIMAYIENASAQAPAGRPARVEGPPVEGYPANVKRLYSGYGFAPTAIKPPWATLTAYDLNVGAIKWQIPYGSSPFLDPPDNNYGLLQFHSPKAPVIVTATGLLLSATFDKKLRALDAKTGKTIWQTDLPSHATGNPAVYEINGRQYVLVVTRGSYVAYALPRGGA